MGATSLKVTLLRHTANPEEMVAMGAKLCYSKADMDMLLKGIEQKDQSPFIEKLVDMGHMSPIEHASFTFGIEGVSRSFLAQVTRHRIASFSVQSQRYVGKKGEETFAYVIPPAIEALGAEAAQEYMHQMDTIQGWYNDWCDKLGNAGERTFEDARFVLPNASETKMLLTMNARELMHFFHIRCCNRAQWEIRAVAWHMLALCRNSAPYLFRLSGPSCLSGPCTEGSKSCGKVQDIRRQSAELDDAIEKSTTEEELFANIAKLLKHWEVK
ncbi:FAD-dependent thymidylate synthase [Clostridia bacterium OttesenSCG-928-F22]|nr:FAD-dependent thymidylate synthase [Clostridia bacterium OttesenSCG-928-F22]